MIHKLIHPFEHNGETYTVISLPDALKLRHQIASMRAAQLTTEKSAGLKVDISCFDEATADPDVFRLLEVSFESDKLMIEAFCEDLPSDAIGELAMDDVDVIKAHINGLLSRNKGGEAEPAKKLSRPAPSS
jgi:hypothetical protein